MIITLSDSTKVKVKDSLTWGEMESVQDVIADTKISVSGNGEMTMKSMREMQYKILEIAIVEITSANGEAILYTKDWMKSLSIEDGTELVTFATGLLEPKKK